MAALTHLPMENDVQADMKVQSWYPVPIVNNHNFFASCFLKESSHCVHWY